MKCFIVNNLNHDFSALKLESPEKIVTLLEGKVNIFQTDRLYNEIKVKMKKEKITKEDYLVVSGPGSLNVLAALAMYELTKTVNLMIYNFTDKEYKKRSIVGGEKE